jgi:hypothetical protein
MPRHQQWVSAALYWRPIETAPKDGTCVIVYRPNGGSTAYGGRVGADTFGTVESYPNSWAHSTMDAPPTHWMPLPDPPEIADTEQ